jgi:hypothetical protein
MNESVQTFLDGHLPIETVVAWSTRLPDQSVASHCYRDWISSAQVEQALDSLTAAAKNLNIHGIQPLRICSVFEHLRIHLSVRDDGSCLALFVENRETETADALDRLLEEFRVVTL